MPHCGGANSCNCIVTGEGVSGSGTLSDPYVITSVPAGGGGGGGGVPTWSTISGKPAVVAEGATQADARTAIGAGTSDLAIGTTGTTAAAGNRAATETAIGMVELATTAEATTGTDTTRAVTPAGLKAVADTKAATSHTHTASQVSDSTATGRSLLTATDAAAARTALGLGTAATTASTAYATAVQGAAADAALSTAAAPELIRDTIATALVAGSNVTITPNDGADTITIAASGGGGGGGNLVAYGAPNATLANVIGRDGGSVLAAATDRLTSHYNAESFTCDAIGLVHRSGNTTATYRLAIWSGAPNPALVFKTPEFSTGAGESTPLFTVAPGTVFPRGVWYVGLFLTSGTSGNFGGGARDVRMEPQRDVNNSGAFSFNLGTIAPGWEPPSAITPIDAWGSGSMPQLIAQNVRPA